MKVPLSQNFTAGTFLLSALTSEARFISTDRLIAEFEMRKRKSSFDVEKIAFRDLDNWHFNENSGDLVHSSGKFFKIEGVRVHTDFEGEKAWEQPIINQPEIGILGIITKKFDGIRYFLMQAKMEPGNINILQLSPTVQATKSNYTRVHKGKQPLFLEFFLNPDKSNIIVDQLQSEQGARFLRKRNRNMIVEVEEDLSLPPDYYWLTLRQIKELLKVDNFVNMDARSVLSAISFETDSSSQIGLDGIRESEFIEICDQRLEGFAKDLFISMTGSRNSLCKSSEIISWLKMLKERYECRVEQIPLKEVKYWQKSEADISHQSKDFFSIIAVSVQAETREVKNWTQPMLKQASIGTIGFITQKINGTLHVLIQGKVEAGYIDKVEMAPTVSFSDVERRAGENRLPCFAEFFIKPSRDRLRLSVLLSEEGGRFYHSQNRYMIVELKPEEKLRLPDNYTWMTFGQLVEFTRNSGCVNVEARSLLSCLKFF